MGGIGIILDLIILFALVGGVLWNMRRGFLRALMGLLMLFLAMTVAALLYRVLLNWFGGQRGRRRGEPHLRRLRVRLHDHRLLRIL